MSSSLVVGNSIRRVVWLAINFAEIAMSPVSQFPGSLVPSRHERASAEWFNSSQNAYSAPGCARGNDPSTQCCLRYERKR